MPGKQRFEEKTDQQIDHTLIHLDGGMLNISLDDSKTVDDAQASGKGEREGARAKADASDAASTAGTGSEGESDSLSDPDEGKTDAPRDDAAGDEGEAGSEGASNILQFEHIKASREMSDGRTEMVFTLPSLDGDADVSDDVLQELTDALITFLGETDGNGRIAVDYIVGLTEGRVKISQAKTIEELERAIVDNMVLPLARSAAGLPNPNSAVSSLLSVDDKAFLAEFHHLTGEGLVNEDVDVDAIDFARMETYFIQLCASGIGDAPTDAALADVAKYHVQRRDGNLPEIPHVRFGFLKKIKMARQVLKQQARMLRTMLKQTHNLHDIEIWYSRYALSAPIEIAKEEGFVRSLAVASAMSDEAVRADVAQISCAMGFDCTAESVNYARVAQGMRTFSVNKTGYSYPENWIYAAMSRWESDERKLS